MRRSVRRSIASGVESDRVGFDRTAMGGARDHASTDEGPEMDQTAQLLLLIAAAAVGIIATLIMLRRQRVDRDRLGQETPFATSTEGEKRCPECGMGNLWTESRCIACKAPLRG
jgi:hypothetical protein